MINIVLASDFRKENHDRIIAASEGKCNFSYLSYKTPLEEAKPILENAEVIIGFVPPQMLACAKKLKWFQLTWAGLDVVMGKIPEGVLTTNTSGAFGTVISEHILACLLSLCRRFPAYSRSGKWKDLGSEQTLENKRALILGAGDIGARTAERLRPFMTHTVGIRRNAGKKPDCFDEMYTMAELDEQLQLADFVLCCLPGTSNTAGLLDERRLRLMKKNAILVNVGRGSLIDTAALERVMAEGHLFGAGLDVTNPEPLPENSPLWSMDNVIITPHVAGIGFGHLPETEAKVADICCENIRRYLNGEELINRIDLSSGTRIVAP